MIYQISKIQEDVRVCLDQNRTDTALLSGGDEETLRLDELIRSKVEEGVRRVHMAAPYYMLEGILSNNTAVFETGKTCGYVKVSGDYMRLVSFKMSDWRYPVHDVITSDAEEYHRLRSGVSGIGGSWERPVCAIGLRKIEGEVVKVLEFYSCQDRNATVEHLFYMPKPEISNTQIDISELCYPAVVYTVAALTLVSVGEAERAKGMFEMVDGLMG